MRSKLNILALIMSFGLWMALTSGLFYRKCDCGYSGGLSCVAVDSLNKGFRMKPFSTTGSKLLTLDSIRCIKSSKLLKLNAGVVYHKYINGEKKIDLTGTLIIRCYQAKKDDLYWIKDTLFTTKRDGRFKIAVEVKPNEYIAICNKDYNFSLYSLEKFR